ncbi:MAG: glycosyltransferase [Candidatus Thermoplasmatota archaeon]|jgi:1,2-diacylglycerol 3-alpha-glucosyltransferase
MRVAIFTDSWFPRVDGITTSVQGTMRLMEARGHTFHIFCSGPEATRDAHVTRYKGFAYWGYPDFHVSYKKGSHDTEKILREEGFDLVHIQTPFFVGFWGLQAARAVGLPVVTSYHTYMPDLIPYFTPPGMRALGKRAVWRATAAFFRRCHVVLAPSPSCAAELVRHVPGHKIRNLQVHPNGVDTARFHLGARDEAVRRRLTPDGKPVLLYVGRLAREKDVEFLVAAFARALQTLPGMHLAIGGSGPDRERIEDAIVEHGLQGSVTMLGFIPDADLASVYASADAFASASRFETQGMTAVEAQACGLPVAAVRARGLADYVRHRETGFLFEPGDLEGAAQAIVRAIQAGPGIRAEARRHAEDLSLERSTDQLEQVYRELLQTLQRERQDAQDVTARTSST